MGFGITGALLLAIRAVPPARLTYREGDAEPELCGEIGAIRTQDRYKRAQIRSQNACWDADCVAWADHLAANLGKQGSGPAGGGDERGCPAVARVGTWRGCVDRQPTGQVTRSSSH